MTSTAVAYIPFVSSHAAHQMLLDLRKEISQELHMEQVLGKPSPNMPNLTARMSFLREFMVKRGYLDSITVLAGPRPTPTAV